jgi:hypothetical protein
MDDIWEMQEEGTYLDVKGSEDSTLGEESALIVSQEKGLKYYFSSFCRRKKLPSKGLQE